MKAISEFKNLIRPRASGPKAAAAPGTGESGKVSDEDTIHAARLVEERMQFRRKQSSHGEKGHAHDPTDVEPLLLGIGLGGRDDFNRHEAPAEVVSDSPTAVDFNIYDQAYQTEVEHIKAQGARPKMYLTRHIEKPGPYKTDADIIGGSTHSSSPKATPPEDDTRPTAVVLQGHNFADVVAQAVKQSATKHDSEQDGAGAE